MSEAQSIIGQTRELNEIIFCKKGETGTKTDEIHSKKLTETGLY
jgi:hypothetical protein